LAGFMLVVVWGFMRVLFAVLLVGIISVLIGCVLIPAWFLTR